MERVRVCVRDTVREEYIRKSDKEIYNERERERS